MRSIFKFIIPAMLLVTSVSAQAAPADRIVALYMKTSAAIDTPSPVTPVQAIPDTSYIAALRPMMSKGTIPSIYQLPYSMRGSAPNWHRMWVNTAVFAGAFVGTLLVLECLPEDAKIGRAHV